MSSTPPPELLAELAEWLRIPSISADPAHGADVRAAGEWLCERIRGAGGTADLVEWEGQPLAVGELRASKDADAAPTVLCYGHFDVQPPDPLDRWESEPFDATVRGEWLYGRGVADDKGQLYLLVKAAEQLAAEGALPVNLRFACDGEEETGGHSIVDFLAADERGADAAVIFDSDMVARGRPAFNVATRGLCYFHLTVRTGARDLHSGMYGGAALNAMHALTQILAAVVPRGGRSPEPLRAGIAPVTDEERASWSALPGGEEELGGQGARPVDPHAAEEFYLRTWAETALDVNGIGGGSPLLQKTVLPVEAVANVSIRLAPGQDPHVVAAAFEQLVEEAAPEGAEVTVELWSWSEPGLVPTDAPAIRLGLDAFERALGTRPLLIRSGGTLPIVPALAHKGVPAVLTGFALPDSNIHSPNERILVEYVPLGIAAARELFTAWRELR
ncbi:MAG TPA: M20/M25/M40 family metallo-hydrolase [Gaiellaceae bacterium]|nr:M20/M25/M40 family metallo-hydrolase [Gaiellaceae bacterium]